ncbi:2-phosphosulfolactate phosphatase [Alkalihalophilus marmarensis]|uniref:2-phosphosulfolactate phosphatase n=1 Tax=Alkalihalophilus marmarensis TaxID=521377 RepID=UPI002DB9B972|nr:2-phosphosulfolactate phosphatase [Alkalihalophilus marmarensis]MEC2073237.1 2-phosphosulfolactate phosphatase [Alkalihalophilus marmarensis]
MRRIHLLTRKEDIIPRRLNTCTVVVIDSLLATSTISLLLEEGSSFIIPASSLNEAFELQEQFKDQDPFLTGERQGYDIDGFYRPDPLELMQLHVKNKPIILTTTNGTVALNNCREAKKVYTSSIVNYQSIAAHINHTNSNDTLLIVCAGNHGRFSIEDFITAGALIYCMNDYDERDQWELSDGARTALMLYERLSIEEVKQLFLDSETGKLLYHLGYDKSLDYVSSQPRINNVPLFQNGVIRLITSSKAI